MIDMQQNLIYGMAVPLFICTEDAVYTHLLTSVADLPCKLPVVDVEEHLQIN